MGEVGGGGGEGVKDLKGGLWQRNCACCGV